MYLVYTYIFIYHTSHLLFFLLSRYSDISQIFSAYFRQLWGPLCNLMFKDI